MKHPIFIGCVLLFLIHQLMDKILNIPIPWMDNYLDTLLCFPILLTLVMEERKRTWQSTNVLSLFEIVVITIGLSLLFEEGFPKWSPDFTRDAMDYLSYGLGSSLFVLTINQT